MNDSIDFIAEQVERARYGERNQERKNEKPCIEVPAPDSAVQVGRGLRGGADAVPPDR